MILNPKFGTKNIKKLLEADFVFILFLSLIFFINFDEFVLPAGQISGQRIEKIPELRKFETSFKRIIIITREKIS